MDEHAGVGANPFDRVVGPWEDVLDDMAATARQHREQGKTAIELHPGDVATLTGEPRTAAELSADGEPALDDRQLGLDVIVPGDEYDDVRSVLGDQNPDRMDVFQATGNGLVFLLLVLTAGETVVLVPVYYDREDTDALQTIARERGLRLHVRPLTDDERVTVTVDDPEPCFPE